MPYAEKACSLNFDTYFTILNVMRDVFILQRCDFSFCFMSKSQTLLQIYLRNLDFGVKLYIFGT